MAAGIEREEILEVVSRLREETGRSGVRPLDDRSALLQIERRLTLSLKAEDEALVVGLRDGLSELAAALVEVSPSRAKALSAALDAVELVTRGELMYDTGERIPEQLPSFVYLVCVTVDDRDEALRLSRRAAELVEGTTLA